MKKLSVQIGLGVCLLALVWAFSLRAENEVPPAGIPDTVASEIVELPASAEVEIDFEPAAPSGMPGEQPVSVEEPAPEPVVPVVEAVPEPVVPVVERVEAVDTPAAGIDPDKIALTLTDTELVQVVDLFIKISGANIIASPTNLTGRVTVSLRDVDWKTALISILEANNLTLIETQPDSKVFSIVTKPKDAPEPLFVESFRLQFLPAESLKDAVKQLVEPTGRVLLAQGNKLSVLGTSQKIKDVRKMVEAVDLRVPQVVVESKFVELDDQAIKDLGINWQSLDAYTAALAFPKVDIKNMTTRRELQQDAQASSSVQSAPPSISDISTTATLAGKNFTEYTAGDAGTASEITPVATYEKVDVRTTTAILTAEDLAITLSALKQNTGTEIISNPKIVVASGETSTIHVGQRRPNITLVTDSSQGGSDQRSFEFGDPPWIETGVKVKVIPTVNTESNITVRIIPELDREIGLIEPTPGLTFPILASRRIETQFALESGKTVAIGGLTSTTDNEVVKKIPFLGDIPILGKYLFSHSHTEKRQSEVIIFVTVELAETETLNYDSGIPSEGRLIRSRFENLAADQLTLRNRGEEPTAAPVKTAPAEVITP